MLKSRQTKQENLVIGLNKPVKTVKIALDFVEEAVVHMLAVSHILEVL
jgi:hypothetical protein